MSPEETDKNCRLKVSIFKSAEQNEKLNALLKRAIVYQSYLKCFIPKGALKLPSLTITIGDGTVPINSQEDSELHQDIIGNTVFYYSEKLEEVLNEIKELALEQK